MSTHEENKQLYLNVWQGVLSNVLALPDAEIQDWIRRTGFAEDLDDPQSWLFHDSPLYWAVPKLIRSWFGDKLSDRDFLSEKREIMTELGDVAELPANQINWHKLNS